MSQYPEISSEDSLIALAPDASNTLFAIDLGPCNAKSMTALWKSTGLAPDSIAPLAGVSLNPFTPGPRQSFRSQYGASWQHLCGHSW